MTVDVLFYSDAPEIGGAEHSLATLLRNLDDRFRAHLATTDAAVGEFLAAARPGSARHTLRPVAGKLDLGPIREHVRSFRRVRPDLVHVNLRWIWTGQYGILAGLLSPGARTIAVEHAQPTATGSRVQRRLRRGLKARVDAHVAVGERTARMIESYVGLPAGTVRTIHNGIEPFEPGSSTDADRPFTIGAIGRLVPEKGFEDLPPALARVPGARIVLVGDGPERERLAKLAREAGVEDRFELVGWQDNPREWLAKFDVLAAPSRLEGSPPLVALEAMMGGLPVVAADVGSVSEAVVDGESGVLVPPGDVAALADALTELGADREKRIELGERGRRLALEEFTAARMAERFEALYEDTLSRGRRSIVPRRAHFAVLA